MINKGISCLLYLLHVRVTLFLLRHVLKYKSIQVIRGERSPGSDTRTRTMIACLQNKLLNHEKDDLDQTVIAYSSGPPLTSGGDSMIPVY